MELPRDWSDLTGASSGIGRATALALARKGAKLMLCSRDANSLENAADQCRSYGVSVHAQAVDVAGTRLPRRFEVAHLPLMGGSMFGLTVPQSLPSVA